MSRASDCTRVLGNWVFALPIPHCKRSVNWIEPCGRGRRHSQYKQALERKERVRPFERIFLLWFLSLYERPVNWKRCRPQRGVEAEKNWYERRNWAYRIRLMSCRQQKSELLTHMSWTVRKYWKKKKFWAGNGSLLLYKRSDEDRVGAPIFSPPSC